MLELIPTILHPITFEELIARFKFSVIWKIFKESFKFITLSSILCSTKLISLHRIIPSFKDLNKSMFSGLIGSNFVTVLSFAKTLLITFVYAVFSSSEKFEKEFDSSSIILVSCLFIFLSALSSSISFSLSGSKP